MEALAYDEPDVEVAEVEDITMQILLLDEDGRQRWHKKAVGGLMSACGDVIDYRLAEHRIESYDGHLCVRCFTPFELAINSKRKGL